MYQYTAIQWLMCFYIYCLIGWCWESAYVSLKQKRWINRGFMRGPFLPIYGSGAVMMLVVSEPFYGNVCLTYVAGMIGATILELVTGIAMEMLFKVRYWDYSSKKCNFKGYICLGSSLTWGVFTVLMTSFLHKPIDHFLLWLPQTVMFWAVLALTAAVGTDFVISFIGAMNLSSMLQKMENVKEELSVIQKRIDAVIAFVDIKPDAEAAGQKLDEMKDAMNEAIEKLRSLREGRKMNYRRRILVNPTMVSQKYKNALEDVKQFIRESKKK